MQSNEEVKEKVKKMLSIFVNMPESEIKDNYILKENPLLMDSTKLKFLALSLRGYVKSIKEDQTVTATEVSANGLTVAGLIDSIYKKVE